MPVSDSRPSAGDLEVVEPTSREPLSVCGVRRIDWRQGSPVDVAEVAMTLFVSYSSRDEAVAKTVISDLESAGYQVWFDEELRGGQSWWQAILLKIREAEAFVLLVSPESVRSRPCQVELRYARDLQLPVIPILIEQVELRTLSIAAYQVVDYRKDDRAAGIALVTALQYVRSQERASPDTLPPTPPMPYEYLMRLGNSVDAPHLDADTQRGVFAQLRQVLEDEEDGAARVDAFAMLKRLRARNDVTFAVARDIDSLLHEPEASGRTGATQSSNRPAWLATQRSSGLRYRELLVELAHSSHLVEVKIGSNKDRVLLDGVEVVKAGAIKNRRQTFSISDGDNTRTAHLWVETGVVNRLLRVTLHIDGIVVYNE